MAPSKKTTALMRSQNAQFRMRLRTYTGLLANIEEDYKRDLLVPEPPKMVGDPEHRATLSEWADQENRKNYRTALQLRLKRVQGLQREIQMILSVGSALKDLPVPEEFTSDIKSKTL